MKLKLSTVLTNPKTRKPYTDPLLIDAIHNIIQVCEGKVSIPDTTGMIATYLKSVQEGQNIEDLTVGIACYEALCVQDDKASLPSRKRGELCYRILNAENDEITIDNKEATAIQELVQKRWNVPIAHQLCEILDGNDIPTVKPSKGGPGVRPKK